VWKSSASNLVFPEVLTELGRGDPVQLRALGGGCIAQAMIATFSDGSRVFVKTVEGLPGMFACEAQGLAALADADAIRVPEVLVAGEGGLVLEEIQSAPKCSGFFKLFGRSFARLHAHRGQVFGLSSNNFIGSTVQINTPVGNGDSWPEFYLERRLRFQAELAQTNGHGGELLGLLELGENRIVDLLGESVEPPSILHGDLWGGNYLVDELGKPCLIDPAVYFGHRESDLAMTRLFGGFDPAFYSAYQEAFPLAPGHEARLPLYQLYHLLNHLNLFGSAYYSQCRTILQRYA
jgi:protein-ribulosamine 3-kinase